MKPKPQPGDAFELFQSHFDQLLNPDHELVLVAKKINWPGLEAASKQSVRRPHAYGHVDHGRAYHGSGTYGCVC